MSQEPSPCAADWPLMARKAPQIQHNDARQFVFFVPLGIAIANREYSVSKNLEEGNPSMNSVSWFERAAVLSFLILIYFCSSSRGYCRSSHLFYRNAVCATFARKLEYLKSLS